MAKQTKVPTKKKIELSSQDFHGMSFLLTLISDLFLPCEIYLYSDMKFKSAKLLKKKFSKMLSVGERYTTLKLDFEECVTYYYCCRLNGLKINNKNDVLQFMLNFLTEKQIEDLNEQIGYIKPFYSWAIQEIPDLQSANQSNNFLET